MPKHGVAGVGAEGSLAAHGAPRDTGPPENTQRQEEERLATGALGRPTFCLWDPTQCPKCHPPPIATGLPSSHNLNAIMCVYITVTYNSAIYIQLPASLCAHKILTLEGRLLQKCL